ISRFEGGSMSTRSSKRANTGRSHIRTRSATATAALVGGAGLVLAAPGAALLAHPAEAQALPQSPGDVISCVLDSVLGGSCVAEAQNEVILIGVGAGLQIADPILDIAGAIPVLNVFIGNGADGTAAHPNGFNGGLLIGSGGDGWTSNVAGVDGGDGG